MGNRNFWEDPAQANGRTAPYYGNAGPLASDVPDSAVTLGWLLVFTATAVSATLAAVGTLGLLGWL